jgi:DNA-binding response OmpR family regulator
MSEHNWPWRILLIEDNPIDEKMVRKCLIKHGINCDLLVLEDGQLALDFIDEIDANPATPVPDIVLLDIGLPYHDGLDVLREIRASERFGLVPVIVMTSSERASERFLAAKKNAPSHAFEKNADYESFLRLGDVIKDVLKTESARGKAGKQDV